MRTKVMKVALADLKQDPDNARLHSSANREMIERSITKVGPARPIVTDEDGVILAGNATQMAALKVGVKKARVIDVAGDTLVAVRVTGLTDVQKMELAMYDNRSADLGAWDVERLKAIEQVNSGVIAELFYPSELDTIFGGKGTFAAAVGDDGDGADMTLASRHGIHTTCIRWRQYRFYLPSETGAKLSDALNRWVKERGQIHEIAAPLIATLKARHA